MDPEGGVLIADSGNRRLRRVAPDGAISTVAGNGAATGADEDGVGALDTALQDPTDVAVAADGTIYVVERGADRVRRIATDGLVTAFAGTGTAGFGGDGGVATRARLDSPSDLAVAPDGSVLIADTGNERVRRVAPSGVIETLAGNGTRGFGGDGSPATGGELNRPSGVAVARDGRVLIADTGNDRVRQISLGGQLNTVAGNGQDGPGGDGGPASKARARLPFRPGRAAGRNAADRRYRQSLDPPGQVGVRLDRVRRVGDSQRRRQRNLRLRLQRPPAAHAGHAFRPRPLALRARRPRTVERDRRRARRQDHDRACRRRPSDRDHRPRRGADPASLRRQRATCRRHRSLWRHHLAQHHRRRHAHPLRSARAGRERDDL